MLTEATPVRNDAFWAGIGVRLALFFIGIEFRLTNVLIKAIMMLDEKKTKDKQRVCMLTNGIYLVYPRRITAYWFLLFLSTINCFFLMIKEEKHQETEVLCEKSK